MSSTAAIAASMVSSEASMTIMRSLGLASSMAGSETPTLCSTSLFIGVAMPSSACVTPSTAFAFVLMDMSETESTYVFFLISMCLVIVVLSGAGSGLVGVEDVGDLGEAAPAGQLGRGDPPLVGHAGLGAVREQQLDDLLAHRPAVAEDDRLDQRGPPEVVGVVDVDPGVLEQVAHDLQMTLLGRGGQAVAAHAGEALEVGARLDHELHDLEIVEDAPVDERVEAGLVLGVDVDALGDQRPDDVEAAAPGREQDGARRIPVDGVLVRAVREGRPDSGEITGRGALEIPLVGCGSRAHLFSPSDSSVEASAARVPAARSSASRMPVRMS